MHRIRGSQGSFEPVGDPCVVSERSATRLKISFHGYHGGFRFLQHGVSILVLRVYSLQVSGFHRDSTFFRVRTSWSSKP